jgi:hypothetical protein
MKREITGSILSLGLFLGWQIANAGQGLVCFDFLKLSEKEQRIYLNGYLLGAGMELQYFQLNLLGKPARKLVDETVGNTAADVKALRRRLAASLDYLDGKYTLINIGGKYTNEFHQALVRECGSPGFSETGMFDVLPSTLRKMKETGKYPVYGM